MEFALLKKQKFEYVGNQYKDKSLFSRISISPYRGKERIYYLLPNEKFLYFYSLPKLRNKKDKDLCLAEFRQALEEGFLPKNGAKILKEASFDPKIGTFDIFFGKYYSEYSTGERTKLDESKKTQKTVSRAVTKYFVDKNINSFCEITDEHLKDWEKDLLLRVNQSTGEPLAGSTRNSYRKCFRAFLNTAKEEGYPIQCKPEKMNIYEFTKGGEIDEEADVRQVIFPLALIEAVENCSYPLDLAKQPDIRKIIRLWREIGGRTGEMLSFGEDNIVFQDDIPVELQVQELPEVQFTPKTQVSKRSLPLSNWAGDYILSLIHKFEGIKRYAKIDGEQVEFPTLFVFKDRKGNWVRDDKKFKELFKEITEYAIKEFKLPYTEKFTPYDLRRSCNLFLRKELGLDVTEAAKFLGHSKETNEKHYTLPEDHEDINKVQIQNALNSSMKRNSNIASMYSRQTQTQPASAVQSEISTEALIKKAETDLFLSNISQQLTSFGSSGFVVMKEIKKEEECSSLVS